METINKKSVDRNCSLGNISYCRELIFGISTCWLMLFHSSNIDFHKAEWIPEVISSGLNYIKCSGNIGVDIFLILSGIGLFYSFSCDDNIKAFYLRRAKRILPAVLICSSLWFGIANVGSLKEYLIYVNLGGVFVYGESYFWYFSLLIVLYFLYPLGWKLIHRFNNGWLIGSFFILIWTLILVGISNSDFFIRAEIALTRIPAFIIGCMFGKYVKDNKQYKEILNVLCMMLVIPLIIIYNSSLPTLLHRYIGTICSVTIIIAISGLSLHTRLNRVPKAFFEIIGQYSMEIYLLYSAVALLCTGVFNVNSESGIAYYIPVSVLAFILAIGLKAVSEKIVKLIDDVV